MSETNSWGMLRERPQKGGVYDTCACAWHKKICFGGIVLWVSFFAKGMQLKKFCVFYFLHKTTPCAGN